MVGFSPYLFLLKLCLTHLEFTEELLMTPSTETIKLISGKGTNLHAKTETEILLTSVISAVLVFIVILFPAIYFRRRIKTRGIASVCRVSNQRNHGSLRESLVKQGTVTV